MERIKIIIVGAGFAGFRLAKKIELYENFDVLLVNPSNHFLYNPLLHEACTGQIPKKSPLFNINILFLLIQRSDFLSLQSQSRYS